MDWQVHVLSSGLELRCRTVLALAPGSQISHADEPAQEWGPVFPTANLAVTAAWERFKLGAKTMNGLELSGLSSGQVPPVEQREPTSRGHWLAEAAVLSRGGEGARAGKATDCWAETKIGELQSKVLSRKSQSDNGARLEKKIEEQEREVLTSVSAAHTHTRVPALALALVVFYTAL